MLFRKKKKKKTFALSPRVTFSLSLGDKNKREREKRAVVKTFCSATTADGSMPIFLRFLRAEAREEKVLRI